MDYNRNRRAGIPPSLTFYPNPSPLAVTQSNQSAFQNPNPTSGQGLFFGYGQTSGATRSVEAMAVYYQDPNVVRLLGSNGPFGVGEVAALSLNGSEALTLANVNSNFFIQPPGSVPLGRGQKKIKQQPAWCDVCKLSFNSKTVLDQHNLGKKHKRSLDISKGGSVIIAPASAPLVASAASDNPFVRLQQRPNEVNSANGQVQDLGTKKRKLLEAGVAIDKARTCLACNVICNSETAFQNHLIGRKHIANIAKQQSSVPASASLVPSEVSVNTFIGPQEKPDMVKSGNGKDAKKAAAELIGNLEIKTQKVLGGGAATSEIRKCLVCKVVCNSETVFSHHLAGKKHIANMKKQASGVAPAS